MKIPMNVILASSLTGRVIACEPPAVSQYINSIQLQKVYRNRRTKNKHYQSILLSSMNIMLLCNLYTSKALCLMFVYTYLFHSMLPLFFSKKKQLPSNWQAAAVTGVWIRYVFIVRLILWLYFFHIDFHSTTAIVSFALRFILDNVLQILSQ